MPVLFISKYHPSLKRTKTHCWIRTCDWLKKGNIHTTSKVCHLKRNAIIHSSSSSSQPAARGSLEQALSPGMLFPCIHFLHCPAYCLSIVPNKIRILELEEKTLMKSRMGLPYKALWSRLFFFSWGEESCLAPQPPPIQRPLCDLFQLICPTNPTFHSGKLCKKLSGLLCVSSLSGNTGNHQIHEN